MRESFSEITYDRLYPKKPPNPTRRFSTALRVGGPLPNLFTYSGGVAGNDSRLRVCELPNLMIPWGAFCQTPRYAGLTGSVWWRSAYLEYSGAQLVPPLARAVKRAKTGAWQVICWKQVKTGVGFRPLKGVLSLTIEGNRVAGAISSCVNRRGRGRRPGCTGTVKGAAARADVKKEGKAISGNKKQVIQLGRTQACRKSIFFQVKVG